jgi:hypothetical protein
MSSYPNCVFAMTLHGNPAAQTVSLYRTINQSQTSPLLYSRPNVNIFRISNIFRDRNSKWELNNWHKHVRSYRLLGSCSSYASFFPSLLWSLSKSCLIFCSHAPVVAPRGQFIFMRVGRKIGILCGKNACFFCGGVIFPFVAAEWIFNQRLFLLLASRITSWLPRAIIIPTLAICLCQQQQS